MDLANSIKAINSSAEFSINADDINQITWLNGTTPISVEDIKAKQAELKAEYEAKQYQRDRAKEYPPITEQLDMMYWDKVNGTDNFLKAIQAVKAKYPKE